jgi:large repetitive protein
MLAASAALAAAAALLAPASGFAHPAGSPARSTLAVLITNHPANPSNHTTAKFAWRRVGHVSRTACQVDALPWKPCTSKITYKNLLPGVHTFRVKVSGRVGGHLRTAARKVRWTIDTTPPTAPAVSGGSAAWSAGPVTISGTGSTDPGGAVARYEHRTSPDGSAWSGAAAGGSVAVSASGQTFVQVRAVDTAGNVSAWAPAVTGAADTALIDATNPAAPILGGALAGWQNVASETVTAAGSADGQSGVSGYQYRTSTDAGATWSAVQSGAAVPVAAEGRTDVEFRAVDGVGNHSAWAQATVRIDTTAPTAPAVSGGAATWRNVASVLTAATGSTDTGGSGVAGYEYETSTTAGVLWSAPTSAASLTVSAEGETLVRYAAVDGVGLQSAWTQATVRLDHTAPSAPVVAGGSLSWLNLALVSVTAGGSIDTGGSGLDHYRFETSTNGGATWGAPTTGTQADVTAEGETMVRFDAVDAAGNTSAWAGDTVRIDTTPPTDPSVSGGSSAWKNVASVTVSAAGATDAPGSGVAGYEYETSTDGGGSWSPAAAGASLGVSAEGETLVRFRAVDTAGFTSGWKQATVRIDRTAPSAPAAAGGSASWQSVAQLTITGGGSADTPGSGIAGYQYRTSTDGGASWSGATAGASVDVTANGETLVQFRALDASGLRSAWVPAAGTAVATARIDRSAPSAPTVSGGSNAWKSQAQTTVTASGSTDALSGLAGYEYRESTDGGSSWGSAAAGAADVVSAEGETLVQFRSLDAAGNASAWTPSAPTGASTVRLDRTDPSAPTVTGGSLVWQDVASVAVSASGSTDSGGSGPATYEHRTSTDGGTTWSAASAGAGVTVSAQGETLVELRAVDGAGNTSAWVSATVRIDRTNPSAPAVAGGSSAWQSAAPVSVSASGSTDTGGSGLAAYEYRTSLNGGAWSSATTGASVNVAAEGTTQVQFRSVDGAGNTSAWTPAAATAGSTVKLDLTAPTNPAVAGGSALWQSVASLTLSASGSTDTASGVAGYEYEQSTNGGATWSPLPTAGASVTVSIEGEMLVRFRAVDGVGRTSAWVQGTARVDRTAPSVPNVGGGSLSWQNAVSVTVTGSGSTDTPAADGVNHYDYRTSTDGGTTWSAGTTGASAVVSAEGTTLVQFRAVDGAGNASAWTPSPAVAGNTVKLDRGAPTNPTVSGATGAWSNAASVVVTASGSTDGGSAVAGYEYQTSFNGGAFSSSTAGSSVTVSAQGTTVVQFRSIDAAGNRSGWVQGTVKLDRTVPTNPTVSGGSTSWSAAASRTISASGATDALSGLARYEYRTSANNGSTWSATTAGAAAVISAEGTTIVQFRSVDNAGNVSSWLPTTAGTSNTVKLDRTAPSLPTVSGGSLTCTSNRITIRASGSTDALSGLSTYQYRYTTNAGATWSATVTSSSITIRSAGNYIVQFRSVDRVNNISAWAPATAGPANQACHT